MTAWLRGLCFLILGLTIATGVAQAQTEPALPPDPPYVSVSEEIPELPRLLVFCREEDKTRTVKALEDVIEIEQYKARRAGEAITALKASIAALDRAGISRGRPEAQSRLEHYQDGLAHIATYLSAVERRLAAAKARKIVDCSTAKGALPPVPRIESAPWTPRKGFCDAETVARYIRDLEATLAIEKRNEEILQEYWYELYEFDRQTEDPRLPFGKFKKESYAALQNYHAARTANSQSQTELTAEIARAKAEEPVDCGPPRAAGLGGGGGALPWSPHRPAFVAVTTPKVPDFCDEPQRNSFLSGTVIPELGKANQNVVLANTYLAELSLEFAKASREGAPVAVIIAIRKEIDDFALVQKARQAQADELQAVYLEALRKPVGAICPPKAGVPKPVTDGPAPKDPPKDGPKDGPAPVPKDGPKDEPKDKKLGCRCLDDKPIPVGSNAKVGSGARTREKAMSTAMGLVGGLLGGGGGGGGGGGASDGPQLVSCRIKDSEMTLFDDPATGVALKVAAKRAGDKVVVFADVARSPDFGTFQTSYLQDDDGARQAPKDVGICGLWGEWKLTVSWTKSTYVDGQLVQREEGGWQKSGQFRIPGTLSSSTAPDGLWKRLGFSNASHGAKKIALTYDLPKARLGDGPMGVAIHVTRPAGDPVTTAPFVLVLHETPAGFVFDRAPHCLCDDASAVKASFSEVQIGETTVDPIEYRTGTEHARTPREKPPAPPPEPPTPPAVPPPAAPPATVPPRASAALNNP